MKRNLLRIASVMLCLALLLSGGVLGAFAISGDEDHLILEGNLLLNADFESYSGSTVYDWVAKGAGSQRNNPHTGSRGFYLDGGTSNYLYQEVIVPYSGWYNTSAWITNGADNCGTFSLRYPDGRIITEITLGHMGSYNAPRTLPAVELAQGTRVRVYVGGGSNWVNGDDASFTYDVSKIDYDLMKYADFSENATQRIRVPRTGGYIFTADVTAQEAVTVSAEGQSVTVPAGQTQPVRLELAGCTLGRLLTFTVSGKATVENARLVFDLSSIPNEPPVASDVKISGAAHSGLSLAGSYTFSDPDEGQTEGATSVRWLIGQSRDGEFTAIDGATGSALLLNDAMEGKFVKFEVTPVDSYGKAGQPALSEAAGPVQINWVRNPGLELETGAGEPVGWRVSGGASLGGSSSALAHGGFRCFHIPSENTDGAGFYALTVERSAFYTLGAYIKLADGAKTTLGVRSAGSDMALASVEVTGTGSYQFYSLGDIALEKNATVEVYVQGNSGRSTLYADDFQLLIADGKPAPAFTNLLRLTLEGQLQSIAEPLAKTVTVTFPYGTDVRAVAVRELLLSEGASLAEAVKTLDLSSGSAVLTVVSGDARSEWTVVCKFADKRVALESDNKTLEEGFNWASNKTQQFVMTGQTGAIDNGRKPNAAYIPSYWAGYYNRTAFYSRDFVHQATGAELVGLTEENYRMFEAFAKTATQENHWYAAWALNFDGSVYYLDYQSPDCFVREVPAQFELVEKAYKQFLWSGDERYLSDEMFAFYTNVMTKYVETHDENGNGVAQEIGTGIFNGSATYNERGGRRVIEAGDAIGSQYQATLAYAGFCKARGDEASAQQWLDKAAALKKYFNEEWSVADRMESTYVSAWGYDGTKYSDFSKETSWFLPLKLITEPGERTDKYLDFIAQNLGNGRGTTATAPNNIEAYTYIPDLFFLYNRSNDAWKWMKYILSVRDDPHENAAQGTNGDYPEISYTLVSQTVEGMMGVTPNAQEKTVTTVPRLPDEVGHVTLKYQQLGDNEIRLTHKGNTASVMTNVSGETLSWKASFYGEFATLRANGVRMQAQQETLNGLTVSYVTVPVAAGQSVTVEVDALAAQRDAAAEALDDYRAELGSENYRDAQNAELDALVREGKAAIEAADSEEAIASALTETKQKMAAVKTAKQLDEEEHVHDFKSEYDEKTHWTVCSCGEKTESAPHSFGAWKVTRSATEQKPGEKQRVCKVCGYTQTEEVALQPKTGDSGMIFAWICLFGLSCAALSLLLVLRRRRA